MSDERDYSTVQGIINVALVGEGARLPTRAHDGDAGLDLYAPKDVTLDRMVPTKIDLGVVVDLKPGEVGLLLPRSSMNAAGIHCYTGVIDAGYKGSISAVLQSMNATDLSVGIKAGERIAQLVILPVKTPKPVQVSEVAAGTSRGTDGFGSTKK